MNYPPETQYEALEKRGVSRRDFLKFCSFAAVYLGLGPTGHLDIANAMENKPRLPVVWINGLSCSCCTESFIRSAHPLASDIVLSMISLDYQDTIMAAAGHQAAEVFEETITEYKGRYILAVEGNAPLADQGMACFQEGRPFLETLKRGAEGATAVICWGTCASWGCVQAAHPNPTRATPVPKLIHDKPIIRIPGCPPIPEVMSNVVAYILTYERLPELDSQKRPAMFYGKTVHDQCVRRAHFDAGQFVESWDDPAASLGYCLYKMGCKGPTTYNACPVTRWNDGVSYPIESGHGCIGCSENDFWDRGSFYDRITTIPQFGTNTTANTVGLAAVGAVGAAAATHAAISTAVHLKRKANAQIDEESTQPHTCCHSHQSTDNTNPHTCCSNSTNKKTQNTAACCQSKSVMNLGNSNETTDS